MSHTNLGFLEPKSCLRAIEGEYTSPKFVAKPVKVYKPCYHVRKQKPTLETKDLQFYDSKKERIKQKGLMTVKNLSIKSIKKVTPRKTTDPYSKRRPSSKSTRKNSPLPPSNRRTKSRKRLYVGNDCLSGNTTVKTYQKKSNRQKKKFKKSISKSKIFNTISPRNIDQSYNKSKINCLKVKKKIRKTIGDKQFLNQLEECTDSQESADGSKIIIPHYKISAKNGHKRQLTETASHSLLLKKRHFANLNLANYQNDQDAAREPPLGRLEQPQLPEKSLNGIGHVQSCKILEKNEQAEDMSVSSYEESTIKTQKECSCLWNGAQTIDYNQDSLATIHTLMLEDVAAMTHRSSVDTERSCHTLPVPYHQDSERACATVNSSLKSLGMYGNWLQDQRVARDCGCKEYERLVPVKVLNGGYGDSQGANGRPSPRAAEKIVVCTEESMKAQIDNQKLSMQLNELKLQMKNFILNYKLAFQEMSMQARNRHHRK
ncbi:unnamed protein product [Moneuplotes crassus]|uniref:Uncharacterized protein n=1 Tax=Euplotes crassus TaxID=5936 RepID=A0AAD1UB14_EUPCR|nr:unnamed protein product [Moneuplotes crassus]